MRFFPGFSSSAPSLPPPAPVAPPRDSAESDEAIKKQRSAEKRRKGRQATILAAIADEDELGSPEVRRPAGAPQAKKDTFG